MPQTTKLDSMLSLVSHPRLQSYERTFGVNSSSELYCTYLWSQQAAGILYPLFQNIEVTLRNAIDSAAKKKYGEFWWEVISFNSGVNKFLDNINKARAKLDSEWRRNESIRYRCKPRSVMGPTPKWTHDQIVAATDFSTWQFILSNQFDDTHRRRRGEFLWPNLLGKVFKQFNMISPNRKKARIELMNRIDEIRKYRNRVFHHEPIWVRAPNVIDARTAIDSIRNKINKIEALIEVLDRRKLSLLKEAGVFMQARRICSLEELNMHCGRVGAELSTSKQRRVIRKVLSKANTGQTSVIKHNGKTYGFYLVK